MTLALTIALIGFLMLAMAIGVMFTGRPLKGSCGGVGGECPCDEAGRPGACDDGKGPPELRSTGRDAGDGVVVYGEG